MTENASVQIATEYVMSLDDTRHERAKEVFEEMHRALMPVMVCNNVEPAEELFKEIRKAGIQHGISVVEGERPKIEIISPFIYRMPKE